MSAELETLLNDLIMRAERTAAEFRHEVAMQKRVEEALARLKHLNAAAFNEAIGLLQSQPLMVQTMSAVSAGPHLPTWN